MIVLAPLSILYGAGVRFRYALYRSGIFRKDKVAAPVISVGNITTGGTGKTPLVAWIAEQLTQRQYRVCILTRGYGRANSQERVIVSDGNQILRSVDDSGDEPSMLAEQLKGKAAVICDTDRVAAAQWAIENLGSEVFILDDGFQNVRIVRDLDIVTLDAMNPWGNRKLLPAGILREPIDALKRADCVAITRKEEYEEDPLLEDIRKIADAPIVTSRIVSLRIRPINSSSQSNATKISGPVAAFCAIGNPEAFFKTLRDDDHELCQTFVFRDHHKYTQADINRIVEQSQARGAKALLTTAKDEVKLRSLRFDLPGYVVDVGIEIVQQAKLLELIEAAISKKKQGVPR